MTLLLLLRPARKQPLLKVARGLVEQKHPGPAVVIGQTAAEVAMEAAIEELLRASTTPDAVREWITGRDVRGLSWSPRNRRVERLWKSLTNDEIRQAAWWSQYCEGLSARDQFVHSGVRVKRDAAVSFLNAVEQLVEHVTQRVSEVSGA